MYHKATRVKDRDIVNKDALRVINNNRRFRFRTEGRLLGFSAFKLASACDGAIVIRKHSSSIYFRESTHKR